MFLTPIALNSMSVAIVKSLLHYPSTWSHVDEQLLCPHFSFDQRTALTPKLFHFCWAESDLILSRISFPFKICRNINRIKVCMETGRTVILLNLESLYESLYDALNQVQILIAHFRVVASHYLKARLTTKLSISKRFLFSCNWNSFKEERFCT